jgi:hypothetical protein
MQLVVLFFQPQTGMIKALPFLAIALVFSIMAQETSFNYFGGCKERQALTKAIFSSCIFAKRTGVATATK